jgi:hypothetical protein
MRSVFQEIQKELREQISGSVLEKFKEAVGQHRNDAIEAIDELLEGAFEAQIDVTAFSSNEVRETIDRRDTAKEEGGANATASISVSSDAQLGVGADVRNERGFESATSSETQYSKVLLRTFNVNAVIERLQ